MYDPDQLAHIREHMDDSKTTGSYFERGYFSNAKEVVEYAAGELRKEGYDGTKTVIERDLPETIGRDALIRLDKLPEDVNIETEKKGRLNYPVKVVRGIKKRPTRHMVIIVGPLEDTGRHGFYTIFPGTYAPNFPATEEQLKDMGYEGDALNKAREQNHQYREFWENHALIGDE